MKLNKDELDKIVAFIRIAKDLPGHEQFIADLRKVLEIPTAAQSISHSDVQTKQKVDKIEKYLALDYTLDSKTPNIDYSFITDIDVRNQLESDYREMLRYRYGLRGHKTDFSEFCRYVQLQAEMVLNYYYDNRFDSNDEVKAHISDVSWLKKIDNINYFTLLVGFCSEHKLDYSILDDVRIIRNSQSHRSSIEMDIDKVISTARKYANEDNFDKRKMIFKEPKVASDIAEAFKSEVGVDVKTYNLYIREYLLNKNQPYNGIIESLSRIVNCISKVM